ncbi:MAG: ABC transporter substrate-binding protein [Alphaproteobacteria bacterium]|nr:ABC transporter substrate-binding protein [Alphaproteobacteria bacterium]
MSVARRRLWAAASLVAAGVGLAAVPAAAQPLQERTLRVATWDLPSGRGKPFTGFATPVMFICHAIFDAMIFVNEKGTAVPALATSWKNTGPTTWEFTLCDTKFHNGEALTPAVVVETFDWLATPDGKSKGASVASRIAGVTKVVAKGANVVEITTDKPNPIPPNDAAIVLIIEPKAWQDLAAFKEKPVGTGPYRQLSLVDNASAKLTAFEDGWRRARIRNLEIFDMPERPPRLQSFLSGQLDIILGAAPDNSPALPAANAKIDVNPGHQVLTLGITQVNAKEGVDVKPLLDKRVRRALNYGVDKENIVKNLLGGVGGSATGQGVASVAFSHDPNVKPYPYDPERAKKFLAEDGYPTLDFDAVPGAFPADGEIFQQVTVDLKKIGINSNVRVVTFADWRRKFLPVEWDSPVWHNLWASGPSMDATAAFVSQSCGKGTKPYLCDPKQHELLTQISSEFDGQKRRALIYQLIALQHEEAVNLFVVEFNNIHATQPNVVGFRNENQHINYHEITFSN